MELQCLLFVLCGVVVAGSPHHRSPSQMCAEFEPSATNQTVLGKCTSYSTLDTDKSRVPKHIMHTICQGGCKCCAIRPARLYRKLEGKIAEEIYNDHRTDRYQCVQQHTTINVIYSASADGGIRHSVRPYTFPSDCLCASLDSYCNKS